MQDAPKRRAATESPEPGPRRALEALNFFMADMQAGVGPFLGVFLLAHGWKSGMIGSVMTIGGVAGMMMTAPAGALVDATKRKRALVVVPGICVVLASAIVLLSQKFWLVAASQVATAVAGAAIVPAVAGITLGMMRQRGFPRQNARNQAFNHAGNVAGAALSGLLGWWLGLPAVFWLAAGFAAVSIAAVMKIPKASIDDAAARGLERANGDRAPTGGAKVSGINVLFESKPLLALAAALAFFHLGNGAMLPLYGLAMVSAKQGDPARLVATTIVVAQAVMVMVSLIALRTAEKRGYWLILLVSFLALPVRGLVASQIITHWGVYPVQMLDGVGAGLQSVAVPGLVARILADTGRVNVGQGAVMTVQGLGAALSPALGGWLAEGLGYPAMFGILGSFALASIGLWMIFRSSLRASDVERGATVPSSAPTR